MRLKIIIFILCHIFLSQKVFANSGFVSMSSEQVRSRFFIGPQASQFTLTTGSLSGFGLAIGYEYFLSSNFSTEIAFGQIFGQPASKNSSSVLQSITSSIQTGVSYALFGKFGSRIDNIQYQGITAARIREKREFNLRVGLGLDQYWFNGSEAIYPASGVAAFMSSDFSVFDKFWIKPTVRCANLTSGTGAAITAISGGLIFDFSF